MKISIRLMTIRQKSCLRKQFKNLAADLTVTVSSPDVKYDHLIATHLHVVKFNNVKTALYTVPSTIHVNITRVYPYCQECNLIFLELKDM